MKKGDILELSIDKYAFEGKGVARVSKDDYDAGKKYVVFVENSFPGDIVKARVLKIKKAYAEAKTVEIIKSSPYRGKPACKYFTVCGGCRQQDIDYNIQVKYKHEQVKEIFERLGGFKDYILEDIIPSADRFYYRNKMEFSFEKRWLTDEEIKSGKLIDREFALGLHIPGVFDKVLDIDECFLQSETSNGILNFTRDFFKKKNSTVYSTKYNSGYLRNLVIREAKRTNDLMVNLVTFEDDHSVMKEYADLLIKNFPKVTTIVNNINIKKAATALGDYENIYYGSGYIFDYIGGKKFRVSANSFFQTNTLQAQKLYDTVMEYAGFGENDIIYDLYSGAGTITIYMSGSGRKIYGFESALSAIKDAEVNRKINDAEGTLYYYADLYKSFLPLVEKENLPRPDVIVTDPPRSGMHQDIIKDIITLSPDKIIYVSCNPASQARDIKLLSVNYELVKARPVDMFPHTYHIENVALLIKRK